MNCLLLCVMIYTYMRILSMWRLSQEDCALQNSNENTTKHQCELNTSILLSSLQFASSL